MDSQGNIYALDCNGNKIDKFGSNYEYISSIVNITFNYPCGIAIDRKDRLIIVDWSDSPLHIITNDGHELCSVGTLENTVHLKDIRGVTVMNDGKVVVTDHVNQRVYVTQFH